jgi:hypothetical protein
MAYASRTGTRRNLDLLRALGWGLMISATGVHRAEGFARWAVDNGAWTAHSKKRPWDEAAFVKVVERLGPGADFIVAPDIVAGGLASLRLSETWLPRLAPVGARRVLIAVQDGMTAPDVAGLLGPDVGLFVGGSCEAPTWWKTTTLPVWGQLARERGAYLHVGRVNTARRIRLCALAGAHSFDGSSATRFAVTARPLDNARRQVTWVF